MKAVAVRSRIQLKNILFATDFSHTLPRAHCRSQQKLLATLRCAGFSLCTRRHPKTDALPTSEVLPTFMDQRRTILTVIRPLSGHTLRCNKAMSASFSADRAAPKTCSDTLLPPRAIR